MLCLSHSQSQRASENAVKANNPASEATFNLLGQKVSTNAKGLVIKGGKKLIVK